MKHLLAVAALAVFLAGCDYFDPTPVKVQIVTVWSQAEYEKTQPNGGNVPFPHVVLERLDTGERIMKRYDTFGKTGDVFAIKQCNLHW